MKSILILLLSTLGVLATETENLDIQALPAKSMTIDGEIQDWDLSGGVLVCSDVENLRSKMGTWVHVSYDEKNLYVLSRWLDETPMGNRGTFPSSYGWRGDCLQIRIIAGEPVNNQKMICWVTAWRDRKGQSVIDLDFPKKNHQKLKNAVGKGAQQAFKSNADGKGYIQEIAIPWSLLTPKTFVPKVGESFRFSVEPNFNAPGRITMKGIFASGRTPDRVFTFLSDTSWGNAIFREKGNVKPQKLRLSDRREFDVTMRDGVPTVDWTKLFEAKKTEGFAKINFEMPEDGFVSLNIKNSEGQVVRQFLTANFMAKGKHEMLWDGLTNMSHWKPGDVLPAGDYSWEAIYHKGLGLRLVGWAGTSAGSPFGRWGGDHGAPRAVASRGRNVYLGWSGAEAGQALVCMDINGRVRWSNKRGGFGGANHIAVSPDIAYINDGTVVYRLDAKRGGYRPWKGSNSADREMKGKVHGLAVTAGKLYVSMEDGLHVLDAETGKELKLIAIEKPGDVEATKAGKIYVLSAGSKLLLLTEAGTQSIVSGLTAAKALAADKAGNVFVALGDPANQVVVFDPKGKEMRRIGKKGGRPLLGPWEKNGMRFVQGLNIDDTGKLWVAEHNYSPKRFSCWNAADGKFVKEFFGPTTYGALGGAISPLDPLVMIGSGCEWKLDEKTGRATCVGVFHRGKMETARFGIGPERREYVAIGEGWIHGRPPVAIYERLASGDYKLRTRITPVPFDTGKKGRRNSKGLGARVWADVNGDQKEQPSEVNEYKIDLSGWICGWGMPMTQTMIFYGSTYRLAPTGWTACGAPQYDVSKAKQMPIDKNCGGGGMGTTRGCGSQDGRLMVYNGWYGKDHALFTCYDIESGKKMWTYPNNYVGVHGGHKAPPPKTGMIRGAYTIVGTGKLPDPVGDVFVVSTDKGEWHVLTGDGYYLSHLFQANPLKRRGPSGSGPGAILDNCPPGAGTEDFGGSMSTGTDGNLYVQVGKTSFIGIKVVGMDTVKRLGKGALRVTPENMKEAKAIRGRLLQASVGTKLCRVKKGSVTFTGDINKDFRGQERLTFQKTVSDKVQASLAYDDTTLYLGYRVSDPTPWTNGANDPAQMYAMGDTVDFQFGGETVLGDVRLSIGNCKGKNVAVMYRTQAKSEDLAPKKFYSGLVRNGYEMKCVKVLKDARIHVEAKAREVVVEVAIPLKSIGLKIERGLALRGDVGATFSDTKGDDTILRSHWNNQQTGLVADEVYELRMTPKNWGRISFD